MSIEKLNLTYVRQENKSFTTLYNHVIQNIDDAFVLGVYCYLSNLPPDWTVSKQQLMNHFDVGKDKMIYTMKWLNDNHLIEYHQDRNEDGTLCKNIIIVKDGSEFKKNYCGLTGVRINRCPDNPVSGKSAPTNNIYNTNKIKKKKINIPQPKKQVAFVVDLPDWLDKETWEDFKQYRKEIKKEMTELSQKKMIKILDKMRSKGQNVEDVLNQSIANRWQGVFEIKQFKEIQNGNQQSKSVAQRVWERSTQGLPEFEKYRNQRELSSNSTDIRSTSEFLF